MHRIVNPTPFCVGLDVLPDPAGVDTLFVTLKASFTLALAIAPQQPPIRATDEYSGEPGRSSLRRPAERHLGAPGTAIMVLGSAHAPRPAPTVDVSLTLADLRKTIRVHGDRQRQKGGTVSAPAPFTALPLTHERALGGPDDPRNPVGLGFHGPRAPQPGDRLPNLEDPRRPYLEHGDRAPVACLAPIAPHWSPRSELAGTYDDAWRRTLAPYLPQDFNPRFFHAAPPDQITRAPLLGGEPLELTGVTPAPIRLNLPRLEWRLAARLTGSDHPLAARLESIVLETDADRLSLLWRASLVIDRRALELDELRVDLRT